MEELLGDAAVALGLDGADDLAQQQDILDRCGAEELLLTQDLGVGVFGACWCDGGVAFRDGKEAEKLCGVDDGKQVVDLEGKIVGEPVDIVLAIVIEQDLEQARDATGTRVRQHLVVHVALVAHGSALGGKGKRGWLGLGLGEHFVDVVDELGEGGGLAFARMREGNLEVGADVSRIAAEHDNAIGQQYRLFDIVRHNEDGAGGDGLLLPQLEQLAAQVFGGEHVERGEGLIHEEHFGLDDEGACEADTLPHSAGELLGIGGLEAVQTDGVEHLAGCARDARRRSCRAP